MTDRSEGDVYVIAEIGVNHNGDMDLARRLVDVAAEAGADAAKFQTFRTDLLVRPGQDRLPYQLDARTGPISQYEMLEALELAEADHRMLKAECDARDLDFLSTPYDRPSLELLCALEVPAIKVASTDTTNLPFLRAVARCGLPALLSTGACALWEVARAVEVFEDAGTREGITVLHCVSHYPAPVEEVNLLALHTLGNAFDVPVGFSDHTASVDMGAWAVCAGAAVVEKHITLDRTLVGPDHAASLEPDDYRCYVAALRAAERALGDGVKRVQPSERGVKGPMQKSLVAARDLPAGHRLGADDLGAMRPATGIAPLFVDQVVGARLVRPLVAAEPVRWTDLETA